MPHLHSSFSAKVAAVVSIAFGLQMFSAQLAATAGTLQFTPFLKGIIQQVNENKKPSDADIEQLLKLKATHPEDPAVHYTLGYYYESVNFGTLASEEYLQSYSLDDSDPEPLLAACRLHLRMRDDQFGFTLIRRALAKFPDNYEVRVVMGLYFHRRGDLANAKICYMKAAKIKPPDATLLGALAQLYWKESDFTEARAAAEATLRLQPISFLGLLTKGECLAVAGNYALALDPLHKAFDEGPYHPELAAVYAETAIRMHRPDLAVQPAMITMASTIESPRQLLYMKKRVAALIANLPDKKVDEAADIVNAKMYNTQYANTVYFCLGDVYDRVGKPRRAMRFYETGLKGDPNYGRAYLRLGEDQEQYMADYTAAMKNYTLAMKLLPEDPEVEMRFGRLSERYKNYHNDLAWQIKTALRKMALPES
jgi:tetratricopeptide (TPR) repeat protein